MKTCLIILLVSGTVRLARYWDPALFVLACLVVFCAAFLITYWFTIAYNADKKFTRDAELEMMERQKPWNAAAEYDLENWTAEDEIIFKRLMEEPTNG